MALFGKHLSFVLRLTEKWCCCCYGSLKL